MKTGDWVDLGDGRVAVISAWDEPSGTVVAETPSGSSIERPVSFVTTRWRPVPEDGLRVAAALDLPGTQSTADKSPVEVLILALRDLGGRGETAELRALISPLIIPEDAWVPWWRRTQVRLENDERIDASKARDKVYSLARPGSSLGRSLVPALQEGLRRGRRMADGPQLKRARDRAQQKGPRDPEDEALFRVESQLADATSVDPTDRFMSAELGMWLERWTSDEGKSMLGDDILAIDLLRVPAHASRTLALEWAVERTGSGDSIIFRSAMAAGPPWSDQVLSALDGVTGGLRQAATGILGWSVPGDEDAGPAKLKDDLPTFEKRIEGAGALLPRLPADARLGLWDGALHALRSLPGSGVHAASVARVRDMTARLCWSIFDGMDLALRPPLQHLGAIDRDAFAPLARSASPEARKQLRRAVISWYAHDPSTQVNNVRLLSELLREDSLVLGMEAAQLILRTTNLPRIALQLFQEASDAKRTDPVAASVVNLAVTTSGDDPMVAKALDRLAEAIVEGYVTGAAPVAGPITFSRSAWERFGRLVALRLEEAAANEARAQRAAEEANAEAARLRELAEERARSLAESRTTAGTDARQDVGRLASNLMKPVALAVGDSFEARSLESLQDRLLAVLQRARIVPIHEVGDVAPFDPGKHQWVGEGPPTDEVQAKSPGFMIEGEERDGIVLVPARVVAAAAP